jgi:hemoglobin-like flavoprotein
MSLQPDDPALFHASLDRAMQHPDFLQIFYRRFMDSSEEIASMFNGRDMGRIQKKLKMTLQTVSEHTEGQPGLAMYLELLGRIHQRLNITSEQFKLWRNALIETAEECDELFTPQLRGAWERAIDAVIAQMQRGG